MCLITRQKKAKILKKDLIVYKAISAWNTSIYYCNLKWVPGFIHKEKLTIKEKPREYDGTYTFADHTARNKYENLTNCVIISHGLHSALTKKRCRLSVILNSGNHIEKFKIPAGSEIFKDATGLIVSNQLMML